MCMTCASVKDRKRAGRARAKLSLTVVAGGPGGPPYSTTLLSSPSQRDLIYFFLSFPT